MGILGKSLILEKMAGNDKSYWKKKFYETNFYGKNTYSFYLCMLQGTHQGHKLF